MENLKRLSQSPWKVRLFFAQPRRDSPPLSAQYEAEGLKVKETFNRMHGWLAPASIPFPRLPTFPSLRYDRDAY
jgi:hypothetical protein